MANGHLYCSTEVQQGLSPSLQMCHFILHPTWGIKSSLEIEFKENLFRDALLQARFKVEVSILIARAGRAIQFLHFGQGKSVHRALWVLSSRLKSSHYCRQSNWVFIEQEELWVMDEYCVGQVGVQTQEELVLVMWSNFRGKFRV